MPTNPNVFTPKKRIGCLLLTPKSVYLPLESTFDRQTTQTCGQHGEVLTVWLRHDTKINA